MICNRRFLLPVAAALLALAFLILRHWQVSSGADAQTTTRQVGAMRDLVYLGPRNSLAVLPFARPESDSSPPYLARGLAVELIRQLETHPDLQVTAATSSFAFDGLDLSPRMIAERLKVSSVLNGTLRSDSESFILKLRLTDARGDAVLWEQAYSRPRDLLVELPAQMAWDIAKAMNRPMPEPQPISGVDPSAWFAHLEGRYYLEQPDPEKLLKAEAAFKRAIEARFTSAAARVGLAAVYLNPQWEKHDAVPRARELVGKALEMDPKLADAHLALSYISRLIDWNWRAANDSAMTALRLAPGSAEVLRNASSNEFTLADRDQALEHLEAAIARDPLNLRNYLTLGLLHEFSGNMDESLASYRRLLALYPEYPAAYAYRARVKLIQDKPESALREAEQESDPFWRRYALILAYGAQEKFDRADPLLDEMIDENADSAAYQLAEIFAWREDKAAALSWLKRAYEQKDGGMTELLGNPLLSALWQEPEWIELLMRLDLQGPDVP